MAFENFAGSILVTRQQTRFHPNEDSVSKEVYSTPIHCRFLTLNATQIDIKNLSIIIATEVPEPSSASKVKGKSKAKSEGLEILSGADLRLKAGTHYALVGRNGTGKSTLLHAIAEKLIPGIPLSTRISMLQQIVSEGEPVVLQESNVSDHTALQHVVEGDTYRNIVVHELDVMTNGIENGIDPLSPIRALRHIKHERLERDFFEVQKTASLRSGARGWDARKVLIEYEKKMIESAASLSPEIGDIAPEAIQEETKAAVKLQADLQEQLETMQVADIEGKARGILTGLGFKEATFIKAFSTLSGGWRTRCELATVLTQTSDILILDEPTNFLDLLGIIWLQRYLISLSIANPLTMVLIVSHDRDFVDSVCSEIIIIRDHKITYFPGNLSAFEKDVRHQILRMSRMKDAQERQITHMEKTIHNNIKVGKKTGDDNKLRQAKSRQKKVDDRMGLQVSAKGTRFKLNRDLPGYHENGKRAEIEIPKEEKGVTMVFPPASELRFPGSLVSMEEVSFSYPNTAKAMLHGINLVIHMGDRIGLVGLNGCGKSTLVKLLVDEIKPTGGTMTRHSRLKMSYYSQHEVEVLEQLGRSEPELSSLAFILREASDGFVEQQARQLLGWMGLSGRIVSDVPIAKLSGGQLVRLGLARLLLSPPHLLVLDEISTHLDWNTVKALIGALSDYEGAILLVSHDRFLVRCVIQGESVDSKDSDAESDVEDEIETGLKKRQVVYELKGGKLLERGQGIQGFEGSLESRLKKITLT